ncbi:MAG TPA: UDP-N-acetylmuramoyl-tripeptide--D-alanyl-D-alanine ligase [Burkholderiaceae bacterium]|nr:UDP-N-acetylmuramoyl-tripeptide--D-alanyl-D-alanine ligase [Burkholderiaceae bacterium]HPE00334.1 UDP-N-acetylmuramoyl-tripeptide--D-alanyl-D-alanine ligase [Burkholderiaceae bacterium]HRY99936.1 UDP-N-acetylmuramoyl-tripeptide--D-alanyl-D-alanine ligase [Burkholderiaceae bacterium]
MLMRLAELVRVLGEARLVGDGEAGFASVSTDTRSIAPGALFFALRGERFDAHDFAAQAVAGGAVALVVERELDLAVPQVLVPDARRALGVSAAAWRSRFAIPVIAVAGSNGKTTVTQMIASILAAAYGEDGSLATRGNLNNEIGLPLMLWRLRAGHRAAVFEVGMNHPGEIAYLAELAQATVAVINNAQREHQEFLAGVEATALENGQLIAHLQPEGTAVFPADDACAPIWRQLAGTRRVVDFARAAYAMVTATVRPDGQGTRLALATPAGELALSLAVSGAHNVHNALAAAAAALAIGVPNKAIAAGLASFRPVSGRGVRLTTRAGAVLVDDSYNANPDSVRAAIDLLASLPAPRVLILGDMGEVGSQGPAFHREIGAHARAMGIEQLLATGPLMGEAVAAFGPGAEHHADFDALLAAASKAAATAGSVLVKGSRFMRMERVVAALAVQDGEAAHAA